MYTPFAYINNKLFITRKLVFRKKKNLLFMRYRTKHVYTQFRSKFMYLRVEIIGGKFGLIPALVLQLFLIAHNIVLIAGKKNRVEWFARSNEFQLHIIHLVIFVNAIKCLLELKLLLLYSLY